jgi:anthranilate phosphoribosyltransferase
MTIGEAIQSVIDGRHLDEDQAAAVATEIMAGRATSAQIAALLVALRVKGETVDEITGFVRAMRQGATRVAVCSDRLVDTCGTGGDRSRTFNISTVSAFVAAGAGCKVAKHGNRSISSHCGSADVLKSLGVDVEMTPEESAHCIDEIGVGFLFAPQYHSGARHAAGPRREIGVRTIFNMLGPLLNPAGAQRQLMGVYDRRLTHPIAQVLQRLGSVHCLVVHGEDGLDEIALVHDPPGGVRHCADSARCPARQRRTDQCPDCPGRAGREAGTGARRRPAQCRCVDLCGRTS